MALLRSAAVSPPNGAAGAAATFHVLCSVDTHLRDDALDVDEDELVLEAEVRRASTGVVVATVPLAPVPGADDAYYGTHTLALEDATADAYLVKVQVAEDIDLGDDADPSIEAEHGDEVDSDDVAPLTVLFSLA